MKRNKKYLLISGLILILIVLIICILAYLNNTKNGYTFSEKSFINSNINNVIDVGVEGALPIFSNNGEGVFYDFLKYMENKTKLTFNIQVNGSANYNLVSKNELSDGDKIFFTDHYVVISSLEDEINDLSSLSNKSVFVMNADKDYVTKYLENININYVSINGFSDITNEMGNSVIYAIVPLSLIHISEPTRPY